MHSIDQLILSLYGGAAAPEPFSEFLTKLAREVEAESATILVERQRRDRAGAIFSSYVPQSRATDYRAAFVQDPFVDLKPGRAVTVAEHLGEPPESSPFMQRFMIPHGIFHVLGIDVIEPAGTRVRLRTTRSLGHTDFTEREKSVLQRLAPHFSQAMGVFLRISALEGEREVFAGALTRLSVGAILVAQNGSIIRTTGGAQSYLDRGDPLVVSRNRLVVARDPAKRTELAEAITKMADSDVAPDCVHAISLDGPDGSSVSVLVRPASFAGRLNAPLQGSALVLIVDTSPNMAPSADVLSQLLGFTRAEAEIAALLTQGFSLDDVAASLGVSKHTAKAHLRAIFSKTGATRQSMLVRLILRSVDELK